KKISFDVVFMAIHGTPGEDGKLQGYFDMLGIPYTSCGAISSALTFNKHFCKQVVQSAGILTPPSLHFFKGEKIQDDQVSKVLTFPVFVKPNCGGSSVGMSKVNTPEKLKTALRKAFREDDEVLIETYIPGRELTCGVMMSGKKRIVLPVTEIIPKREFFDFKAKYEAGMSEEIVPAQIPEKVETEVKGISVYLFGKLNCRGVVRFDYIWNGKEYFFLEVNTVPGLSEASIVPKMALSHGFTLKQFYSLLIEGALQVKNR
ncbi:MAG: D-alanine--D-alanine ligase, partial [Bacteroidetes bacterium]|nr:D-alanine--D-alanine ligase [Bacteroidota bacterium]